MKYSKMVFLLLLIVVCYNLSARNISVNVRGVYWIHSPDDTVYAQFGPSLWGEDWAYLNGSGTYLIQNVHYWVGDDYAYAFVTHQGDRKGSGINYTISTGTTNVTINLPQSSPLPPPEDNND